MEYESLVVGVVVMENGGNLFDESATTVRLVDEGAGRFVELKSFHGIVAIDPEEWPVLKDAIEKMIAMC